MFHLIKKGQQLCIIVEAGTPAQYVRQVVTGAERQDSNLALVNKEY